MKNKGCGNINNVSRQYYKIVKKRKTERSAISENIIECLNCELVLQKHSADCDKRVVASSRKHRKRDLI